ncbi:MAG: hypothetical protein ACREGH_01890 [Minisyncoccia bacterium]
MIGQLFKTILLLGVLGIGFMWLFEAGLLPNGLYAPIYNFIDASPLATRADDPALEKFEGHWTLTFSPSASSSPLSECPEFTTFVDAHNGAFSGHATIPGYLIVVAASTTVSGTVSGTLSSSISNSGAYSGQFEGTISGTLGSGSWQDSLECSGVWQLTKLGPANDPAQARIVSLNGLVILERDGDAGTYAEPQENLYVGDVLKTPAGGSATLEVGIGRQLVTIPGDTS